MDPIRVAAFARRSWPQDVDHKIWRSGMSGGICFGGAPINGVTNGVIIPIIINPYEILYTNPDS